MKSMEIDEFRNSARKCTECRDLGFIHDDVQHGWAYPLFDEQSLCPTGIVIIGEAPNADDTYNKSKQRLTYDIETDPTGNFARELLLSVGLKVADVLFTNSVLCLPAYNGKKYNVIAAQSKKCSKWLSMAIDCCNAKIVVTLGGEALNAVKRISHHKLALKSDAGKINFWNNRYLLPLYHPSSLGQITRSRKQQLIDIMALRSFMETHKNGI
jgi:uracil-DNA glycosylase family 4